MSNPKQQQNQGKRILRVHLRDPVQIPHADGKRFESATAQFHESEEAGGRLRGAGRVESITLAGQFIVLRAPRCLDVLVPVTQVAWMVPA